jgi:colanic acid biosynthesis glycosyl transferase WcaI
LRIVVHDYAGHPFQFDLSRELARRGHTVAHMYFAGDPGPKGETARLIDDPESLSIVPVDIGRPNSKSDFASRWANDRAYGRAVTPKIEGFRPDVVISGNTPLDPQAAILGASRRSGAAFVSWVQDLYSLAIRALVGRRWAGAGALLAAGYERLERRILKGSDGIVVISDDFREPLGRLVGGDGCVETIPNWAAIGALPLRPKANPWADLLGLTDKFVFLYSGTLALKHNPHRLADLAGAFAHDPQVSVVLTASGLGVDSLKAAHGAASRICYLPLQPIEHFGDTLAAADVAVALLETDAGAFSTPSKVLSYLCAGRPILISAPKGNLAARIVAEAGAGFAVAPDDSDGFVERARLLRADPELRARMGMSGRAYAERHFDVAAIGDRFEAVFRRVAGK